MGKNGGVDYKGLEELKKKLESFEYDEFIESCAKEIAARLLRKVIKRTPTGVYPPESGKKGGTLKRGWTTSSTGDASHDTKQAMYSNMFGGGQNVSQNNLKVRREGDAYIITITNPVEYASYVEYGHRTRNHEGWVKGRFMLTISEREIERDTPKILENKIKKKLGELFK